MRFAVITGGADSLDQVARYMPGNYTAVQVDAQPFDTYAALGAPMPRLAGFILIIGEDNAGWTLDGYVIPRLASGLIFATEIADPYPEEGVI